MNSDLKSGPVLLDEFFLELKGKKNLDKGVVDIITELYSNGKLTKTNLLNRLEEMRQEIKYDKNK